MLFALQVPGEPALDSSLHDRSLSPGPRPAGTRIGAVSAAGAAAERPGALAVDDAFPGALFLVLSDEANVASDKNPEPQP